MPQRVDRIDARAHFFRLQNACQEALWIEMNPTRTEMMHQKRIASSILTAAEQ